MTLSTQDFKEWIEEKANLNRVDSGYVVDFDYEWHISVGAENLVPEYGSYYRSADSFSGYSVWVDVRQGTQPETAIEKVFIILQNNETTIIKELTQQYVENNLPNKSFKDFIKDCVPEISQRKVSKKF